MFWQIWTAVLVALTGFGSLTVATAQETKAANGQKQITNSIGMKLVLIPKGEFKMGSGESAEDTAAFFKDLRRGDHGILHEDLRRESEGKRVQGRASAASGSDHQAVFLRHLPCHADNFGGLLTTPATRRTRRRTRIRGPSAGTPTRRSSRSMRGTPGGTRGLSRRTSTPSSMLAGTTRRPSASGSAKGRQDLPTANGGRMGICVPCRDNNAVLQR